MSNNIIKKYKDIISDINSNPETAYDKYFHPKSKYHIPLKDLIELINNDVLDPKKYISNDGKTLLQSYYFNNKEYNNHTNDELVDFLDLLIKKGLKLNKSTRDNTGIDFIDHNNSKFIINNLNLLLNKYRLNTQGKSSILHNGFSILLDYIINSDNPDELKTLLPIFLRKHKRISSDEVDKILIKKNSKITDPKIRLNNLKQMTKNNIHLRGIGINYGSDYYNKDTVKTIDEFFEINHLYNQVMVNEFIFTLLFDDFEKNISIIENNLYEFSRNEYTKENYIKHLLSTDLKDPLLVKVYSTSYLEFLAKKIEIYNQPLEKYKYSNRNPFYSKEQLYSKIINNLEVIKNKYHVDLSKFIVNEYISNAESLNIFIDYGFKIDFTRSSFIQETCFDYKKIVEYNIPEKICADPKDFTKYFFRGREVYKFFLNDDENLDIINDSKYLELYINKYGLKLNKNLLIDSLNKLKSKESFDVIVSTHKEELIQCLSKNITSEKLIFSPSVSEPILTFMKENLEQNLIEKFVNFNFVEKEQISPNFLISIYSAFDKNELKQMLTKKENIKNCVGTLESKLRCFEILGTLGVIRDDLNYFNEIIDLNKIDDNSIKQFVKLPSKKDNKIEKDSYLALQFGNVIDTTLNKNPEKTCYCNKSLFEAIKKESMSDAINELKTKYPNFEINKCDDYGYTIADYFVSNFLKNQYRFKNKEVNVCNTFNNRNFLKNLTTLVKNGYIINDNLLKELKKFGKEKTNEDLKTISMDYKNLMSHIEKLSIINQVNLPKNEEENRLNKKNKINI